MSGSGRKSSYRKAITDDVLYGTPEPTESESIVQVVSLRGTNIFQVKSEDGSLCLAMLPHKFKKLIWVKRGDFLIVSGANDDITISTGKKGAVQYLVEHILYTDQIKHLKTKELWPAAFLNEKGAPDLDNIAEQLGCSSIEDKLSTAGSTSTSNGIVFSADFSDENEDDTLFVNRNRVVGQLLSDSSDDED